jgi:hypothetical protein
MKVRNRPVIGSWWSSYYIAIKVTPHPKNRQVGRECSLTGFRGLRGFGDSVSMAAVVIKIMKENMTVSVDF